MFTWNDSREAARAFVDGIRITVKEAGAVVVSVSKPGDPEIGYRKASLQFAVAHLKAHGIKGRADQALASDIGLMDALLNEAADFGADLLVLGAFGGQGYPRFSRGSGSRFMLKHMTLPVLLSPRMSTVASVRAARAMRRNTSSMAVDSPSMWL